MVDDDFRNIFALTVLLERGHLDVISAESGQEAIAALQQTPDISLVMTDIMMPVMSGYETIRAIRKLPHCADLPILAITASVTAGERERCIDAGASAYIPKPVDSADLLVVLGEWLPSAARRPRRPKSRPRPDGPAHHDTAGRPAPGDPGRR